MPTAQVPVDEESLTYMSKKNIFGYTVSLVEIFYACLLLFLDAYCENRYIVPLML